MTTPTRAKICSRCGQDCSNRPRQKDRQGRYVCGACASTQAPVPPPDGTIPLVDDAGAIEVAPYEPPPAPISGVAAPGIEARLGSSKCPSCGYDIRGLKKARCPECGMLLTKGEVRRVRDEQDARRVARRAYLRPAIIGAVFAALLGGVLVLRYGSDGLALLGAGLAGGTLAVTLVYVGCGILFLGFDAPLRLIAVQVAAVVAGTSFVYSICGWLPSMLLAFGIPGFVCIWMMHSELDLEIQDAALTGLPSALAIFAVWYVVAVNVL